MKRSLLTTAAAIALLAGSSVAFAEGMGQGRDSQASPSMNQAQPKGDDKAMPKAAQDKPATAPRAAEDRGRSQSQTTGQGGGGQAQQPSGQPQQPQRQPSGAQAPEDRSRAQGQTGQRDSQTQPSGQQQRQPSAAQQSPSGSQQSPTTGQAARPAGDSVTLTAEQKTKVRTTVLTSSAPRVTNINFSINVGTVVPRTVKLVAVPAPLIQIHPAWRGYMYFVYNDEIIIVEPRTLKIVAVLDV